jgi:hypothetical protein
MTEGTILSLFPIKSVTVVCADPSNFLTGRARVGFENYTVRSPTKIAPRISVHKVYPVEVRTRYILRAVCSYIASAAVLTRGLRGANVLAGVERICSARSSDSQHGQHAGYSMQWKRQYW